MECQECFPNSIEGTADFVSHAFSADDIFRRDLEVIKVQCTCRRCSDAQFLLFLCDLYAHILGSNKTRNAFVAFGGVDLRVC
jgi:hypothetical protein